jgi:hypothetical protein
MRGLPHGRRPDGDPALVGPGGVVGEVGRSPGPGASPAYLLTGVAALEATWEALERETGRADWMRSFVEAGIEQFAELDEIRRREASPRLVAGNESVARPGIHRRIRWDIWGDVGSGAPGSRTSTRIGGCPCDRTGMGVSCPAEWTAYQLEALCLTHLADPELARRCSYGEPDPESSNEDVCDIHGTHRSARGDGVLPRAHSRASRSDATPVGRGQRRLSGVGRPQLARAGAPVTTCPSSGAVHWFAATAFRRVRSPGSPRDRWSGHERLGRRAQTGDA